MRRANARNRLLVALAVILSFAFVGVSVINYRITQSAVRSEILHNDLPLTMDNIYSDLTAELTRPLLVSSSMAADTFLKEWVLEGEKDHEKIQNYLSEIREKYGFFTTFFVSAYSSNYYHFKGLHKQITPDNEHDIWYYRFIASDKEYDLDVDNDEAANNILTLFINYRVLDSSGRLLGVTGVGLKIDSLAHLVTKYQDTYSRNVYLTDRRGVIQVHKDTKLIEKANIAELEGLHAHAESILSLPENPAYYEYLSQDQKLLLNVRYIRELDWMLFVEQNETHALQTARMNFWRTIIFGICASVVVILLTLATINRYQRKVERLIITDELTGISNRRKLETDFDRAVYSYSRTHQPLSLILMDLDGFKDVNDIMGHVVGDGVLRTISDRIGEIVRPSDTLARWGGDEFALLTTSSVEEAANIAERIRVRVEQISWPESRRQRPDPRQKLTISCGIADFTGDDSLDHMLHRADLALYRCKANGGNRVEVESA